jgi:hypothetical protein
MSAMASAGDAKILLLDFTMPFLAGGCVEIRLAARERLHDQPFIIRPPEAPKCGELATNHANYRALTAKPPRCQTPARCIGWKSRVLVRGEYDAPCHAV